MTWRPRHLTRTQLEERRLAAGRLLQAGHLSHAAIARQMGVSRTAVSKWAKQLRRSQSDLESLRNRPAPGRPSRLTMSQWQYLLQVLQRGALQAGFDTDRWTLRRIRALMLVEFGVEYHAHYLARRLTALGWSPQHPAVYARERDDALVHAWLLRDGPRMKKRLAAEARKSSSSMRPAFPFAPRQAPPGPQRGRRPSSSA
jgi:transposase